MIKAALAKFDWNIEKTVAALQISRATLYRKIAEYKLNKRK
jgi:DNA-binding NtrC family response regulator